MSTSKCLLRGSNSPRPSASRRRTLALLGGSLCFGNSGLAHAAFHGINVAGQEYGPVPKLVDQFRHRRHLADFKGRVVLLFFGFTQCPDVCPTALSRAVETLRMLGDDGDKVQVIFVTLDPERDTPNLLQAYMAAFHPKFLALRGNSTQTASAAAAFKVMYQKVPTGNGGYTMDHTAITFVIDREGRLRLALRHSQTAREVADDVAQLLRE